MAVIDIGGGSTEIVAGIDGRVTFSTSTQTGVVRHTERHIRHDPPHPEELRALAAEAAATFASAVPAEIRARVQSGIAVAGTATSCAAMSLALDPYDSARVHGFRLARAEIQRLMARLAAMTLEQRREVTGLHPDRAPAIVAGTILLAETLRCLELDQIEVSEHDILHGAALDASSLG
jgi:exopolyphosphatase/guanosine-5'-triphosphate,3'-diphosphate pyrophosphatase